jgi:hypothetical protein
MHETNDLLADLHQLDFIADGLSRDKKFGVNKDAVTGDTMTPGQGPLGSLLTNLVINQVVPDMINKYGPDLANVFISAAQAWLKQKIGPPAAA